jgi:hypothetical protein
VGGEGGGGLGLVTGGGLGGAGVDEQQREGDEMRTVLVRPVTEGAVQKKRVCPFWKPVVMWHGWVHKTA